MTIVELIEKIKSENITVQILNQATEKVNTNKKGITKITFITDMVNAVDLCYGNENVVGMIIWCDKKAYKNAIEQITQEQAK